MTRSFVIQYYSALNVAENEHSMEQGNTQIAEIALFDGELNVRPAALHIDHQLPVADNAVTDDEVSDVVEYD